MHVFMTVHVCINLLKLIHLIWVDLQAELFLAEAEGQDAPKKRASNKDKKENIASKLIHCCFHPTIQVTRLQHNSSH